MDWWLVDDGWMDGWMEVCGWLVGTLDGWVMVDKWLVDW